jgi:hypothetical protein
MRILKFETNATEFNSINSLLHLLKTVELTGKKIKNKFWVQQKRKTSTEKFKKNQLFAAGGFQLELS